MVLPFKGVAGWRSWGVKGGLVAWFLGMVAVCGILLGKHLVALPKPTRDDQAVATAMASLRAPGEERQMLAVHVLYAECKCSGRIADHLATSPRPRGVTERIVLVG